MIAAGIAAWVATREGRRKTGDLLATTARAAWARQATVLAATAFWMVLAYLAGVAVIYLQTALQATWGGPPLWPVAVGVVGVAASCAVGFASGTLLPGRFTAPIVAVAVFAAWFVGVSNNADNPDNVINLSSLKGAPALLVPATNRPAFIDVGVYYHVPPDVSIAQVMLMGGVLLVMVGLLALLPAARVPGVRGLSFAGRRRLTVVAAVGVACGVAASATAFSMAGTAQYSLTTGWEIPALHDAADDQPIPYTLDCTGSAFKVCIHPAFAPYLGAMSAALQPAAAEIAGLPGAPARAEMTTGVAQPAAAGTTSVYDYSTEYEDFGEASFWATPALARTADWEQGMQQGFITWFVSGPAQQDSPNNPGAGGGGDRAAGQNRRSRTAVPAVQPAGHAVGCVECVEYVGRVRDTAGGERRPDHRRRERVRVAVIRCPARLARGEHRRAALRHHHPGAAPVTAAEVKTPPVPPASPAASASASAARRLAAGARLAWLHLRSRRVPSALLALALLGGALRAVLHWHLMSGGALAQQGPMVIEAGAAVLIAVTMHSPFGEAERATGRWLPYLRLGAALALTGIAIGALQLGVTGASLPGGVLVLARNVIGITGIGLLASLVTGGLLAWIPPLAYLGFAEYALNEAWRNPWTWPVRPPADRGAWICAVLVFAVGLAAVTFRGARTSLADNG